MLLLLLLSAPTLARATRSTFDGERRCFGGCRMPFMSCMPTLPAFQSRRKSCYARDWICLSRCKFSLPLESTSKSRLPRESCTPRGLSS